MAASSLSVGTYGWGTASSRSVGVYGWSAVAAVVKPPGTGFGRSGGIGRLTTMPTLLPLEDDEDELLLFMLFPFMDQL